MKLDKSIFCCLMVLSLHSFSQRKLEFEKFNNQFKSVRLQDDFQFLLTSKINYCEIDDVLDLESELRKYVGNKTMVLTQSQFIDGVFIPEKKILYGENIIFSYFKYEVGDNGELRFNRFLKMFTKQGEELDSIRVTHLFTSEDLASFSNFRINNDTITLFFYNANNFLEDPIEQSFSKCEKDKLKYKITSKGFEPLDKKQYFYNEESIQTLNYYVENMFLHYLDKNNVLIDTISKKSKYIVINENTDDEKYTNILFTVFDTFGHVINSQKVNLFYSFKGSFCVLEFSVLGNNIYSFKLKNKTNGKILQFSCVYSEGTFLVDTEVGRKDLRLILNKL